MKSLVTEDSAAIAILKDLKEECNYTRSHLVQKPPPRRFLFNILDIIYAECYNSNRLKFFKKFTSN